MRLDVRYIATETAGGTVINREIFPVNTAGHGIDIKRENGYRFYKKSYNGSLKLMDIPSKGITDYSWLKSIESSTGTLAPCDEIYISVQQEFNGTFEEIFKGKFSIYSDVSFDETRCSAEIDLQLLDNDNCLQASLSDTFNLLDSKQTQAFIRLRSYIELQTETKITNFSYWWEYATSELADYTVSPPVFTPYTKIYARERIDLDADQTPAGAGWISLNPAGTDIKTWVRDYQYEFTVAGQHPVIAYRNRTKVDTPPLYNPPYQTVPYDKWYFAASSEANAAGRFDIFWVDSRQFRNGELYYIPFNRGRLLNDVIETRLAEICPDMTFRSQFLQDDENPLSDYSGIANPYKYLMFAQVTDLIRINSTEAATLAETTMQDIFNLLEATLNLHWYVNDENVLIIEHEEYFRNGLTYITPPPVEIDLTNTLNGSGNIVAANTNKYRYDKSKMYRRDNFVSVDNMMFDFKSKTVTYTGGCLNDQTNSKDTSQFIMNVLRVLQNFNFIPENLNIFMAMKLNDLGNLSSYEGVSAYDSKEYPNYKLSWTYLLETALRYNRVLSQGRVNFGKWNEKLLDFETTVKNKEQEEISFNICEGIVDFEPERNIRTYLGDGELIEASYKLATGMITMQLNYDRT